MNKTLFFTGHNCTFWGNFTTFPPDKDYRIGNCGHLFRTYVVKPVQKYSQSKIDIIRNVKVSQLFFKGSGFSAAHLEVKL